MKKEMEKLVGDLVKENFPELENEKIKIIKYPNIVRFLESATPNWIGVRLILINKDCNHRNEKALKGQFAHELSHIVLDYYNKNFISSIWHFIRKFLSTVFNTSFSRKIEIRAEEETIKRGYARELIALKKDWEKKFGKKKTEKVFYSRGYFPPDKIKDYAKRIKKW